MLNNFEKCISIVAINKYLPFQYFKNVWYMSENIKYNEEIRKILFLERNNYRRSKPKKLKCKLVVYRD